VGRFISLRAFGTSKPLVRGSGLLGYDAIVAGTDPNLDDLRQDEELKPFLSNFVDAASVDSIAAVRALKKLIKGISDRQNSVSPEGLDVGPVSDCFLSTTDGIKNINQ
jgi:small ligand-binding sensory domain FIST